MNARFVQFDERQFYVQMPHLGHHGRNELEASVLVGMAEKETTKYSRESQN